MNRNLGKRVYADSYRVRGRLGILVAALTVVLASCAPAATSEATPNENVFVQPALRPPTTIILPDGLRCHAVGGGALEVSGYRLRYTCPNGAEEVGLVGELSFPTDTELMVERVTIERSGEAFVLEPLDTLTAPITRVVLEDGAECINAGKGATLAFDGERLNYTCASNSGPSAADEVGLIGPFERNGEAVLTSKVMLRRDAQGWMVEASQRVLVRGLELQAGEK